MALARTRRFFNHTLVTSLTPEFLLGSNFGKSARPLCLRIDVTRRALGSDGCSLCWRLVRHFFNTWEFPCFWQISTLFSLAYSTSISDILKVRLGEYDVSTTAEPLRHEEINVTEIHIHPDFNNSTLMHDIALLKLEKPAKRKQAKKSSRSYTMSLLTEHFYSQNIDVVCMPKQGDFQYQDKNLNCYITGWGRRAESNWYFLQSLPRILILRFSLQPQNTPLSWKKLRFLYGTTPTATMRYKRSLALRTFFRLLLFVPEQRVMMPAM